MKNIGIGGRYVYPNISVSAKNIGHEHISVLVLAGPNEDSSLIYLSYPWLGSTASPFKILYGRLDTAWTGALWRAASPC
jgi:hypothetical protein